jgi:MoaA/NifB/PqqE/SkfB family radical SAM enzyme
VGSGFLKFEDFRKIVDENRGVTEIELSNYGEILLNPDLPRIVEHAYRRGVRLTAKNGVNLNHAKEQLLEALVRYRFRALFCSIDGASQETYERYRVRGEFETVIANIKKINEHKRRHNSRYPELVWRFIVFGHNENEIPKAREMARELGMGFRPKLSWDPEFSPIRDEEFVKRELGFDVASRAEYRQTHGSDYMQHLCYKLWSQPQINWDGKVLGCSRNFWGEFGGNAFADGLAAAVNSEGISYAREMLQGRLPGREDLPCATCDIYLGMKAQDQWLEWSRSQSFWLWVRSVARALGLARLISSVGNRLRTLGPQG